MDRTQSVAICHENVTRANWTNEQTLEEVLGSQGVAE